MRVKGLGSAAGGGFPQWNCGCSNCSRLRAGVLKGRSRTQAQVAISPTGSDWILLNASPDLRQQITQDRDFAPNGNGRSTPIAVIVLTSADVDCVLGLLHLREFQPLRIYSTLSVRRVLTEENSLFKTLERSNPPIQWEVLRINERLPIRLPRANSDKEIFLCSAISLGGDFPDYVSDPLRRSLHQEEAVVGLEIIQNEKRLFYAPGLPGRGEDWKRCLSSSDLALVDGSFWTDDELNKVHGAGKAARAMGHMPLSGTGGLREQTKFAGRARRVLIHLNNTNPVLDEESAAHHAVRDSGWEVAYDGMEFNL